MMMISVTAAVKGIAYKPKPSGAHFKPYGSGRRPLIDTDMDVGPKRRKRTPRPMTMCPVDNAKKPRYTSLWRFVYALWTNLLALLALLLSWACPFAFYRFVNKAKDLESAAQLVANAQPIVTEFRLETACGFQKLNEMQLTEVFKFLSVHDVMSCQLTCKRWNRVILKYIDRMPKTICEQIKLHFDEGEIIISPADLRSQPRRVAMPPVPRLPLLLRHMTTTAIFIRGMIEIETRPVLAVLAKPSAHLCPKEVYFLWCNFDAAGREDLISFFNCHKKSMVDLGFEECYPSHVISDQLITSAGQLSSLRIWSDGKRGRYDITDVTLHCIARQTIPFDTIDLSNTRIGVDGLVDLIRSWVSTPERDATICVGNCPNVHKSDVLFECVKAKIPLQSRGIRIGNRSLTLCCM